MSSIFVRIPGKTDEISRCFTEILRAEIREIKTIVANAVFNKTGAGASFKHRDRKQARICWRNAEN